MTGDELEARTIRPAAVAVGELLVRLGILAGVPDTGLIVHFGTVRD